MGVEWMPTSTEEQTLKDAVSGLQTSINKAVPNIDNTAVPNRFVLSSKGYFDLRAYVMSGKDFPATNDAFDGLITQKAFAGITTFDDKIYALTRSTMVGIGSSCKDYYNNQLSRLVTAASAAIQYADNTTDLLTEAEGINLKYHLDILLNEKYKTSADQDSAFKESREAALMTVDLLKEDALSKKKEVDSILEKLVIFTSTTDDHLKGVKTLTQQFKDGPVVNNSSDPTKKLPYLQQLNSQYNAKVDEVKKQISEAQEKDSDWAKATGVAVGFAVWPGLGWVVMSVAAAKAVALKNAYNDLMSTIAQGDKDNAETMRVIKNVTTMIEQCSNIKDKMEAAVSAMKELSGLFLNQAACFDKITFYLNALDKGVKSDSGTNRRIFVSTSIKKTVEWLAELKTTALEFQKNIVRDINV